MAKLQNALIIAEAVIAVLLMAGVLIQTPKASGLVRGSVAVSHG